jgi:benzoyl-CoA reductase subunit C
MNKLQIQELQNQSEDIFNQYVRDWKEKGGKVLGYGCVATPVEIIEAAGILPYRVKALGHPDTELADAYLSRFNCRFCRACLQLGLDGTYDFLDGLIEVNSCDHMKGMFENWQYVRKFDFFHYLKVPHYFREFTLDYFEEELALMRAAISRHFSVDISDDALHAAIERQDELRSKLKALFALREQRSPTISGSEVVSVLATGSSICSEDFNALLTSLLEVKEQANIPDFKARLMLCGSATDEVDLVGEIEAQGGLIVADALCFGSRAFWAKPEGSGSPLRLLADRYLSNLLCPRMFEDYSRRLDFIIETAARAKVDGIIIFFNKFCDLHGVDAVSLRRDLEKRDIPVLTIEKEYGSKADTGRLRTRVQAFLERIGG